MNHLFVFSFIETLAWGRALEALRHAVASKEREPTTDAYTRLFRALSADAQPDLPTALAASLLHHDSVLSSAALRSETLPKGLETAARHDLETLLTQVNRDWGAEASRVVGRPLPPLKDLVTAVPNDRVQELTAMFDSADASWLLTRLCDAYRAHGTGVLARYSAFRWNGELRGVAHPVRAKMDGLIGLERQLGQLKSNTLAFLNGRPAHHTLLYGPRGSGKSTAVRSLNHHYSAAGLRLIELPPGRAGDLPQVTEQLRNRPHYYILFMDDLNFEQGDAAYGPLKTLLEGSITERPGNVLVYATSNRRHLVREEFADRPDPLDDDVHAWDSHNERLALADRFGLRITFPSASQKRYLAIVQGLLDQEGIELKDAEARAVKFADWGNGYSGRTAQQFVNDLKAEASS